VSRERKRVTLIEVAKVAGVSKSTVSAVLNEDKNVRISDETKEKVFQAAKEVNYRPNLIARAMKTGKSFTIGVSVINIVNNFYSLPIVGIEEVLKKKGYNILLSNNKYNNELEAENINFFLEKQVDGIILVSGSGSPKNEDVLKRIDTWMPIVAINRNIGDSNISHVNFDNVKGAYDAVKHLIDYGHRDIAFFRPSYEGRFSSRTVRQTEEGYKLALRDAGLKFNEERIYIADPNSVFKGDTVEITKGLISRGQLPTAIFCCSDTLAVSIMRILIVAGIKIPEEVSIVGYNNSELSIGAIPSLTSVNQPLIQGGKVAAELLLDAMHNKKGAQQGVTLQCDLKVRESSGPRKFMDFEAQ
jgi:LacI family transcriptional regulator